MKENKVLSRLQQRFTIKSNKLALTVNYISDVRFDEFMKLYGERLKETHFSLAIDTTLS